MTSLPQTMSVPVGYDASFECVANGVPPPKITWYKSTNNNSQLAVQVRMVSTLFTEI
jgi:hypothetical protein